MHPDESQDLWLRAKKIPIVIGMQDCLILNANEYIFSIVEKGVIASLSEAIY